MRPIFILITIATMASMKGISQIPNPATDPNFYLDTRVSDEFNGTTVNTSIWQIDNVVWPTSTGASVGHDIFSSTRTLNVRLDSGLLFLAGSDIPDPDNPDPSQTYTQGLIKTLDYLYVGSYIETYSKVSANDYFAYGGLYMLNGSKTCPSPCDYREIDIMEYDPHNLVSSDNVYYCTYNPFFASKVYTYFPEDTFSLGDKTIYHKSACLWDSKYLDMMLDGITRKERTTIGSLNQPMNLILFGGIDFNKILHPDGLHSPTFPNIYRTDYVRVYRLKKDCAEVTEISNFTTFPYAVKKWIKLSGATTVPTSSTISLRANDFIELYSGFEVPNGTDFSLNINGCN